MLSIYGRVAGHGSGGVNVEWLLDPGQSEMSQQVWRRSPPKPLRLASDPETGLWRVAWDPNGGGVRCCRLAEQRLCWQRPIKTTLLKILPDDDHGGE